MEHLEFGEGTPYRRAYRERYVDALEPYGMRPENADGPRQRRNSFTDMALAAVSRLDPADRCVDLVIVAHATPDAEPGFVTCTLSGHLGEATLMFAISDQGPAAPFTALRVADAYARTGAHRRGLILLLDQKTVARPVPPAPGDDSLRDSAVALVLDGTDDGRAGGGGLSLWQRSGIDAADVEQVIRGALPRMIPAPGTGRTAVVHGPGLDAHAAVLPPNRRRARDGMPCTGLWAELAAMAQAEGGALNPVVLADYDPKLRYLCLCTVGPAETHGKK